MREVKYKGKCVLDGSWVTGNLIHKKFDYSDKYYIGLVEVKCEDPCQKWYEYEVDKNTIEEIV